MHRDDFHSASTCRIGPRARNEAVYDLLDFKTAYDLESRHVLCVALKKFELPDIVVQSLRSFLGNASENLLGEAYIHEYAL